LHHGLPRDGGGGCFVADNCEVNLEVTSDALDSKDASVDNGREDCTILEEPATAVGAGVDVETRECEPDAAAVEGE